MIETQTKNIPSMDSKALKQSKQQNLTPYLFIIPSLLTLILFIFIPIFIAFIISFYDIKTTTGLIGLLDNLRERSRTTLRNFFYLDEEFRRGIFVVDGIFRIVSYILTLLYTRLFYVKFKNRLKIRKEFTALIAIALGVLIAPLTMFIFELLMEYVPILPRLNVPLKEYRTVLTSAEFDFVRILFNTVFWTLTCTFLHVVLGMFLAIILNRKFAGKGFFRGLFIIPWAVPSFISTLVWRALIFNKDIGVLGSRASDLGDSYAFRVINLIWIIGVLIIGIGLYYLWKKLSEKFIDYNTTIMKKLKPIIIFLVWGLILLLLVFLYRITTPTFAYSARFWGYSIIDIPEIGPTFWVTDDVFIFGQKFKMITFSAIMVNTWLGVPFMMVSFLAALQSIPGDLYEAADIDGASAWQKFQKITFPLLKPTLFTVSLLGIIWTFNLFNVVYLLTQNQTGLGNSIYFDIFVTFIYNRFGEAEYSRAAALSFIVFILLIVFSQIYKKFINVDKIWEGETE